MLLKQKMFILLILLSFIHSRKHQFTQKHNCIHNYVQSLFPIEDSKSLKDDEDRRTLFFDEDSWDPIRIKIEYEESIQNSEITTVIEEVKQFFESFLYVNTFHEKFEAYDCMDYKMKEVQGSDMLIFVKNREKNCEDATLAYAMLCEVNSRDKRPVTAILNICPLVTNFNDLEFVLIHEFLHALGISKHVFNYIMVNQVLSNTRFVPKIVSNKTVEHAREYFDCPTLDGVELDSDWSHLKKRLYFDNIMSSVYTNEVILSKLEFSILDDMSFYQIDWDVLEEHLGERMWGRGLGCSFVEDSCLDFHIKNPDKSPFCFGTENEKSNCTFSHNSKGTCNVEQYSSYIMPDRFKYFDHGVDPNGDIIEGIHLGGPSYMEFCPFYEQTHVCREDTKCFSAMGRDQECLEYDQLQVAVKINNYWFNCSNTNICTREMLQICDTFNFCHICENQELFCLYVSKVVNSEIDISIPSSSFRIFINIFIFIFLLIINL